MSSTGAHGQKHSRAVRSWPVLKCIWAALLFVNSSHTYHIKFHKPTAKPHPKFGARGKPRDPWGSGRGPPVSSLFLSPVQPRSRPLLRGRLPAGASPTHSCRRASPSPGAECPTAPRRGSLRGGHPGSSTPHDQTRLSPPRPRPPSLGPSHGSSAQSSLRRHPGLQARRPGVVAGSPVSAPSYSSFPVLTILPPKCLCSPSTCPCLCCHHSDPGTRPSHLGPFKMSSQPGLGSLSDQIATLPPEGFRNANLIVRLCMLKLTSVIPCGSENKHHNSYVMN